ncbi:MAG: hypothetical protein J0H67_03485 [Rhodospirillales bacterium]|nr:hypothetical protein [Rhodospirillales bacterium]
MTRILATTALAALLGIGFVAATPAHAQQTTTTKQKTGDGDTGAGDRPSPFGKQRTGDGDTGAGDRPSSMQITKQRTGDGDTGAGDRAPSPLGSGPMKKQ